VKKIAAARYWKPIQNEAFATVILHLWRMKPGTLCGAGATTRPSCQEAKASTADARWLARHQRRSSHPPARCARHRAIVCPRTTPPLLYCGHRPSRSTSSSRSTPSPVPPPPEPPRAEVAARIDPCRFSPHAVLHLALRAA
jgi:hypothetical protein